MSEGSNNSLRKSHKIFVYLPDLRAGGAERVLLNLIAYFNNLDGWDVGLVVNKKEGDLFQVVDSSIRVFELNTGGYLKPIIPLVRLIKRERPTYVLCSLNATITAAMAKPYLPSSVRLVARLSNTIGAEKDLLSAWKKTLYLWIHRFIYWKADLVICQSEYMMNDYIHHLKLKNVSKLVRVYNPILPKKSIDAEPEQYDVVSVGRLSKQKDFGTLINAIADLKPRFPQIKVAILGEGKDRPHLEALVKNNYLNDNIKFVGYVKRPERYIRSAKVFALSSLYEGFSNAILEALAEGIPVVASDCPGGNSEVIVNGVNGYLVQVGDYRGFSSAIEKILQERSAFDRQKISEQTHDRFSLQRIGDEYLEYLTALK